MKKQSIITILLTVLMSMVGTKAFASADISVENTDGVTIYYNWTNNKTELSVSFIYNSTYYSFYNEYSGNIVVPESVVYGGNTYQVTSIGSHAFYNSSVTSVTIPNSVTSIGSEAFAGCSNLNSVTIPNNVTSIGSYAFYNCSNLTSIIIPNSVTSIGHNAFYGTAWYNNQSDGLVYAGKVVYKYKGEMPANSNITIKDGTLGITEYAFEGYSTLTSVVIPNSVKTICSHAFSGCI